VTGWPARRLAPPPATPAERGTGSAGGPSRSPATQQESGQVALVDLLDRVLAGGVVVAGDVTLSIADVDLVYISLQAVISSVRAGGPGPVDRNVDWAREVE
jgi:Gas vesicle protein